MKSVEILKICIINPLKSCVQNPDRKNSFEKSLLKSNKVNMISQNLLKSHIFPLFPPFTKPQPYLLFFPTLLTRHYLTISFP